MVNVFNARGNRWKRLRTLAAPTFNVVNLRQILPTVQDSVNETLKFIEEKEGQNINAYPFFQEFTMDVISRIALGQTGSAIFNNEYLEFVRNFFEKRTDTPIELVCMIFPFMSPIIRKIAFFFKVSTTKEVLKAYEKLNQAVRERKKQRETQKGDFVDDSERRLDFIDLFLDAETQKIDEDLEHFDKGSVKVSVDKFAPVHRKGKIIAGREEVINL